MRRLATLILMAAMLLPVAVAAQSPAIGSPLGTLGDFEEFLADHGFMRPLDPNTTAPTQPSSQGWGGSGLDFAWADGPEDALTEVSVLMMRKHLVASRARRGPGHDPRFPGGLRADRLVGDCGARFHPALRPGD